MTQRVLTAPVTAYRIGDPRGNFRVFDAGGSALVDGRWHLKGDAVIYVSLSYSTAMLEKLVYNNQVMPPNQHYLEIIIPAGVSYEVLNQAHVPDWANANKQASQTFGHEWYTQQRSALLYVNSVVARPDRNILINTQYKDFSANWAGLETPIWWDIRLFV